MCSSSHLHRNVLISVFSDGGNDGLERHEGSQKLRIFLVPLGESEETSSTDASAVRQSDRDYQYVVVVNDM